MVVLPGVALLWQAMSYEEYVSIDEAVRRRIHTYTAAEAGRRYESVVLVQRIPASGGRLGGQIVPVGVGSRVPRAARHNTGDVTMCQDGWQGSKRREGDGWDSEGVHLQDVRLSLGLFRKNECNRSDQRTCCSSEV
jgi:hypothetical protein